MRWLTFVCLLGFIIWGCEKTSEILPPEPLLSEATYINLLVEMKLFNAMIQASDSLVFADSLKPSVFDYYGVSEDVFLANHTYYQSFPDKQHARLDSAIKIIEATLEDLGEVPPEILPNTQPQRQ